MSADTRLFPLHAHAQPSVGEPIRSVVRESAEAVIVVWHVAPGQRIRTHRHPLGQDTWIVHAGEATYVLDQSAHVRVRSGDIVVAPPGALHGAHNTGSEPFVFVSVVSPGAAGYEEVSVE